MKIKVNDYGNNTIEKQYELDKKITERSQVDVIVGLFKLYFKS